MFGNTWNGNLSLDTGDGREHYMRLRNELSEDGEELLSDLSSIHLFIDSEHIPDSKVLLVLTILTFKAQNLVIVLHRKPTALSSDVGIICKTRYTVLYLPGDAVPP